MATQQRKRHQLRQSMCPTPAGAVPVNSKALAPYNSYSWPEFVTLGYYVDKPFTCRDCGSEQVWRASQQKWWYEVAKGFVYSTAVLCRACRRKEQKRKAEARKIHMEGLANPPDGRGSQAHPDVCELKADDATCRRRA